MRNVCVSSISLAALLALAAATGCTSTHGSVFTAEAWSSSRASLGKTAVLAPRSHLSPTESDEDVSAAAVHRVFEDAMRTLPGVELVSAESLPELSSTPLHAPLSESTILRAAREHGLDTVCVPTVSEFQGYAWMNLLPPLWWQSEVTTCYGLKVFDVESATVLLEAVRFIESGGAFTLLDADDLSRELLADLETVLAAPLAAEVEPGAMLTSASDAR